MAVYQDTIASVAKWDRLDGRRIKFQGRQGFLPPPSLLYNGYWVYSLDVKQPGHGIDHPPLSSADIKERVELYVYSPSGPSWPVLGWTLPLPLKSTSFTCAASPPDHVPWCLLWLKILYFKSDIHTSLLLYVYIFQTHFGKMFQKLCNKFQ